jgi:hypothetical protein
VARSRSCEADVGIFVRQLRKVVAEDESNADDKVQAFGGEQSHPLPDPFLAWLDVPDARTAREWRARRRGMRRR